MPFSPDELMTVRARRASLKSGDKLGPVTVCTTQPSPLYSALALDDFDASCGSTRTAVVEYASSPLFDSMISRSRLSMKVCESMMPVSGLRSAATMSGDMSGSKWRACSPEIYFSWDGRGWTGSSYQFRSNKRPWPRKCTARFVQRLDV